VAYIRYFRILGSGMVSVSDVEARLVAFYGRPAYRNAARYGIDNTAIGLESHAYVSLQWGSQPADAQTFYAAWQNQGVLVGKNVLAEMA